MADEVVEEKKKRPTLSRGIEEAPTYYANFVGLLGTQWDVCLRFGLVAEATPEKMVVDHVVNVYLSPPHALALLELLTKKVQDYQEAFPTWKALSGDATE